MMANETMTNEPQPDVVDAPLSAKAAADFLCRLAAALTAGELESLSSLAKEHARNLLALPSIAPLRAENQQLREALEAAKSNILKVASELVSGTNFPSEFADDHVWPKTTPKAAIQKSMQGFRSTRKLAFEQGHRLRRIYDSMSQALSQQVKEGK